MDQTFETFIDSYLADQVGVSDQLFDHALTASLKSNLLSLYGENKMSDAGTGNRNRLKQNRTVRKDKIFWLGRENNNAAENCFFDRMDAFIRYLNNTCYTGITDCEFHYAMYEPGSFYSAHIDRFQNDSRRAFSMVHYLNNEWKQGDGGELCLHHKNGDQLISPDAGKSVFFKSDELEHEVMITQVQRLSITGWLKRD